MLGVWWATLPAEGERKAPRSGFFQGRIWKNKESVKKKRPNTENMQPRIQIEENWRPKKKQRKEQQEEKPRNSQDEDVSNAPEFSLAKIEYKLNTSNIINPSQDFFVIP